MENIIFGKTNTSIEEDIKVLYPLPKYGPITFYIMFEEIFHYEVTDEDLEFIELINNIDNVNPDLAKKIKNEYLKYGMDAFMQVASKRMDEESLEEFAVLYRTLFDEEPTF